MRDVRKDPGPLDDSELAERGIEFAKQLAVNCGAEIVLLHLCCSADPYLRNTHEAYVRHHADALELIPPSGGTRPIVAEPVVVVGEPATEILAYAEQNPIGLIVMTTYGRSGIARWLRGSVADKVVRHSPVPVRRIRSDSGATAARKLSPEGNILVLLDGSEVAEQVLPHVVCHSQTFGSDVTFAEGLPNRPD